MPRPCFHELAKLRRIANPDTCSGAAHCFSSPSSYPTLSYCPPPSITQTSASGTCLHNLNTGRFIRWLLYVFTALSFRSSGCILSVICKISRQTFCCGSCPKFQLMLRLCSLIGQSNFEMLYLSIIFLLHVVAVVTSSNSCLIQTCPASRGGDIVAAIYNTSAPDTGGQDDVAAVANFLTLNCGLSPRITQCYVDCHGIYGENGAYWTVQNCRSQCGIVAPLVNCFGYYAWFCSLAVSNVCQLATPSTPTTNRKWLSGGSAIFFLLIIFLKQLQLLLRLRNVCNFPYHYQTNNDSHL